MNEHLLCLGMGRVFKTELNELVDHPDIAYDDNYGYYMVKNTGTEDERYELNIPKGYVGRITAKFRYTLNIPAITMLLFRSSNEPYNNNNIFGIFDAWAYSANPYFRVYSEEYTPWEHLTGTLDSYLTWELKVPVPSEQLRLQIGGRIGFGFDHIYIKDIEVHYV